MQTSGDRVGGDEHETSRTCASYAVCGDGVCAGGDAGDDCHSCTDDYGTFGTCRRHGDSCCGDGPCGWREDSSSCPADCA